MILAGLRSDDCDEDYGEDYAASLLEQRAKKGDTDAMWMLGVCYEYGIEIEQDIKRAEDLYKQSSDRGNEIGWFFAAQRDCERGSGIMKMKCL